MASQESAAPEPHVYAGAGTGGLYRKLPGENRWEELTSGLPPSPEVRVIAVHPLEPNVVFAGTGDGMYRSDNRGDSWRRLEIQPGGAVVWSILFQPNMPSVMYAGLAPTRILRSPDGGDTWDTLPLTTGPDVVTMSFDTRVIAMAADLNHPDDLYAALEVGGVIRSRDRGETWEPINAGLAEGGEDRLDLHGVQVGPGDPGTVYISTREGMFHSSDRGDSWTPIDITKYSPITYTRDLLLSPQDPDTLYVSLGRSARGSEGALLRSRDRGRTWERVDRGLRPTSTMMAVAIDRRNPSQIYCAARGGQVFGSPDDGATWTEYPLSEAATEVYALAVG